MATSTRGMPAPSSGARVHRMKYERDLLLVPLAGTDRSEAMEADGLVTKIGFDATAKPADRVEGTERALPPAEALEAAARWLAEARRVC